MFFLNFLYVSSHLKSFEKKKNSASHKRNSVCRQRNSASRKRNISACGKRKIFSVYAFYIVKILAREFTIRIVNARIRIFSVQSQTISSSKEYIYYILWQLYLRICVQKKKNDPGCMQITNRVDFETNKMASSFSKFVNDFSSYISGEKIRRLRQPNSNQVIRVFWPVTRKKLFNLESRKIFFFLQGQNVPYIKVKKFF